MQHNQTNPIFWVYAWIA